VSHLSKIIKDQQQIAGMDSSDGLADAIVQICRASGVGAEIDSKRIKIDEKIRELVGEEKALEWGLYGGEDFELVLSLEENIAAKLVNILGKNAAIIGKVTKEKEVKLIDKGVTLTLKKGFQHF
jgi:thiamine-monophosphate kinase